MCVLLSLMEASLYFRNLRFLVFKYRGYGTMIYVSPSNALSIVNIPFIKFDIAFVQLLIPSIPYCLLLYILVGVVAGLSFFWGWGAASPSEDVYIRSGGFCCKKFRSY